MITKHQLVLAHVVLLAMISSAKHASAQTHRDTIRGTVTTDSGRVIAGADIIVTIAPTRDSRATKTDSSGRYSIVFVDASGDYLVHISAVGYGTFRKRVTRTGADSVFTVDTKLAPSGVQQLASVSIAASRSKPERTADMYGTGIGASERVVGGVNGAISPDDASDLAALGATIPGIATTGLGLSAAGLDPGQNSTTLNGMAFAGTDIPRDAHTSVRVTTSTYDPARGWFGGLNEDIVMDRGGLFAGRQGHITVDAPMLQAGDHGSSGMGQRFTNITGSLGGVGSMDDDRYTYNYGIQAGRRSSDLISLSDASAEFLQHAGVSPDSAVRLMSLITTAGIPSWVSPVPGTHLSQNVSFIGRLDHAPYDWSTLKPATTTWGLLGYGKLSSDNAINQAPTSTPAYGGSGSHAIGMLQGIFSTYIHDDYLNEERSGFTFSRNASQPYLRLPSGRVLVGSTFPDGTAGLAYLGFGGDGAMSMDTRQWTWETTSETQFYAHGLDAHAIKLNADLRLDGVNQRMSPNTYGTFSFNSLSDLAINRPAVFTRTLSAPGISGSVWNGFVAASDLWRISRTFQMMYGARLEGNRYVSMPGLDPVVQSIFHLRTDHQPNTFHVSPRLGFTWVRTAGKDGVIFNNLGQFPSGPKSYVRGGIGEFRNILPATFLTPTSIASGLLNGAGMLTCVGDATPMPDFEGYLSNPASIPTRCATGAIPTFADAAPGIQLLDPTYTAPRSWRGNLAYSSTYGFLSYSVEGVYSLNLDQPGWVDANFSNVPRFTLGGEGRPVFVDPASIVANSGAVSAVSTRISPSYGHVIDNVSSLTSRSRQITVGVSPLLNRVPNWFLSLNYTLANTRASQTGFTGSTFGSPVDRTWARGDFDIRHQFLLQGGYSLNNVSLTFFGRLQSGLPFTPMVGGDVNGDGLANDRAFIFDPTTTTDVSLSSAMGKLLASSPSRVRSCLTRQIGQPAGRNSCEGPWTTALNAELSYSSTMPITHQHGTISLAFVNPLGGLDQLLHGSDHLHGWGTVAYPDPALLIPTGFDATASRFRYAVNPRFGNTNPTSPLLRSPFRVTLDVSLILGRPLNQQQIDRWIKPGRGGHRGPKLSSEELKRRYSRSVPDPYLAVLQQSDSLLLTRDQADALQEADREYRQHVDSIWSDLSAYLASLPDHYSTADALTRQEASIDAAWELTKVDVQRTLPRVLSPIQMRLLPGEAAYLMRTKGKVGIRLFLGN